MLVHEHDTVHIVTCGISILTNFGRKTKQSSQATQFQNISLNNKVLELLKHLKKEPLKMSAELNSLNAFGFIDISKIYLLATDTEKGELCATVLQKYIQKETPRGNIKCEVRKIPGFGTEKFEDGLINLRNEVVTIISNHLGKEPIYLNCTGGFKPEVSMLILISSIFDIPAYYIYETSRQLIFIPRYQ
ncbi:MAG: putative CRISPR-associated protein [Promethearchaeota archaeon]